MESRNCLKGAAMRKVTIIARHCSKCQTLLKVPSTWGEIPSPLLFHSHTLSSASHWAKLTKKTNSKGAWVMESIAVDFPKQTGKDDI